jgi:hypothetical protein
MTLYCIILILITLIDVGGLLPWRRKWSQVAFNDAINDIFLIIIITYNNK